MLARRAAKATANIATPFQTRGFAINPNEIAKRIQSTKSVEKITKSMKMVSAAKLRGDTERLNQGRPFGKSFMSIFNPVVINSEDEDISINSEAKKPVYVPITTDRGLCGGVNTIVCKQVKLAVDADKANNTDPSIYIVGEKGSSQLSRTHADDIVGSTDETWKQPMNFVKSCAIAERVIAAEGDEVRVVYNRFVSAINYQTETMLLNNYPALHAASEDDAELPAPLNNYEMEPELAEEGLKNMFEFGLAVQLYSCAIENATSEQSARMAAMEGASKNAEEMVESLTILFNRARQARITTELTEIISGAESLKG